MSTATALRKLMHTSCLPIPGAFNALCGLAVRDAGFSACYVSGAATSVCAGVPDVGLLTHEHFCRLIREIHQATNLPVLADADTGFGEAEMVRRCVIDYAHAGAAGLHLEDQKFPKRCGHLDGKELVSVDHMAEKVQWAAKAAMDIARKSGESGGAGGTNPAPAIIICARTDARGVEGFDAAVSRACAYVEAGAEMIFPEGLTTEAEFGKFAEQLRERMKDREPYLLANMTEFGKTPIISLSQFDAMGYDCVIYPVSMLRVAMKAVTEALASLRATGSVAEVLPRMQTRQELYKLVGYTPGVPWEVQ